MPMARNYYNSTYKDPETDERIDTPGSEPYNFSPENKDYLFAYK